MKSKTIIAAAAATVAGALFITYLLKRNKSIKSVAELIPAKKSHHLTTAFAHAKNHGV